MRKIYKQLKLLMGVLLVIIIITGGFNLTITRNYYYNPATHELQKQETSIAFER